ncbi:hypothetical protein GGE66_001722 [Rhizobium leguminosarum]|uniref:Uncharacterized protein n=1 Tax=Rhizobium leguminosarum TaxID=384 RepID=A0A7W9ZSL6_RHILE|nr:hypothetical protein [Rhizobium leguminosarum]
MGKSLVLIRRDSHYLRHDNDSMTHTSASLETSD